ncbi:MAG: beta-ketoacyl-ACP synthase [Gammaproteobacteria bacterium]|nr:beta-ketoacyl-ACP synthase [Gammaproteobacteria bacterium]
MVNNSVARRVVITGAGNITSLGHDWAAVRAKLLAQRNAVRYMGEWDQYPELQTRIAAPVDDFALPSNYRAKQKRSMGRVAQMAVLATQYALENAGLVGDEILTGGQTGVSYGSATGSSAAAVEFFGMLEDQSMSRINTTTYIRMMSHTAAVNIAVVFGTQGRMYTTSSACTAGSQGIGFAYEAIRAGQQQLMIAGGAEELCPTQAAVFDTILAASLRNQSPETAPRPFDADRDGLVLGEGATTLILEEYQHAKNRGAPILAEIIGFGTNTDGGHMIRPKQATMEKAMHLSLADAGVSGDDIGYVSAHGTATEHGDIAESWATYNALGRKPISSLKSYTGHTLGACGAFELWCTIKMMNEGWFAPTLNLQQVDSRCADLDYIRATPTELDTPVIMSNNFAFGGINTSLIVRRVNSGQSKN